MKIGIYDPYLDTLGGGEKYILDIGNYFSQGNEVHLFWDNKGILNKAKERFGKDFSCLKVVNNIFTSKSVLSKISTANYDAIFYISDGSVPLLFSKKNFLIFQFPVNWVKTNYLTKLKLKKINKILCYSHYVKKFIDNTFKTNSFVLPPAIELENKKNFKKENIILTVGRFTKAINTKKQEVLISVFQKMVDEGLKNWKFILVGSVLERDKDFVDNLNNLIGKYPIKIQTNVSKSEIDEYYQKSKIYWHGAGFGEDLAVHPENVEHFGISTVEAMAAGSVPVVFRAGGLIEIIEEGKNGLFWNSLGELMDLSRELINDEKKLNNYSTNAVKRAGFFSMNSFYQKIDSLIK